MRAPGTVRRLRAARVMTADLIIEHPTIARTLDVQRAGWTAGACWPIRPASTSMSHAMQKALQGARAGPAVVQSDDARAQGRVDAAGV